MNAQNVTARAVDWLTRTPHKRTAEEREAYLNGLTDAGVPQDVIDTIEDAFDERNAK